MRGGHRERRARARGIAAFVAATIAVTSTAAAQAPAPEPASDATGSVSPPPPGFAPVTPSPPPAPGGPAGAWGYPPPPGPYPGYGPPRYPPPPGYAAPAWEPSAGGIPTTPVMLGRKTLAYDDGDPVPPGYQVATRSVRGLLIPGLVIFGAPYIGSVIAATATAEEEEGLLPLLIPIGGPFVTISSADTEGGGTFWLIVNGTTQTIGAALLLAGIIAEESYLLRSDLAAGPAPRVSLGPGGGALTWTY